jgi:hypothetical protein
MNRTPHTLRAAKRVTMPKRCIAVASVYDVDVARPIAGVVSREIRYAKWTFSKGDLLVDDYGQGEKTREQLIGAIEVMSRNKNTVHLFAYQLRRFMDLELIWDYIDCGRLSLKNGACITSNPPNIITCTIVATGQKLRMIDLLNYGIEKNAQNERHFSEVLNVFNWCRWYRNQLVNGGMGSWKETSAMQSFHTFRRKCMDYKIHIHNDENAIKLERAAYYGGRCEPRVIGCVGTHTTGEIIDRKIVGEQGPIFHLDVVGSYLGTARKLSVPTALIGKVHGIKAIEEIARADNYGAIAEVSVNTERNVYPIRWVNRRGSRRAQAVYGDAENYVRHPTEFLGLGATIFPIGKFGTTLCGPELNEALSHGEIEEVHQAYLYSTAPALCKWVDYVWPMYTKAKQQGNDLCRHPWKSISLSLFGKFGAFSHRWEVLPDYETEEKWWLRYRYDVTRAELVPLRCISGVVSEYNGRTEGNDTFPAISAWICAEARMKLWTYIQCAREENVYYYDTDSIWCNADGYRNLRESGYIKDSALGFLSFRGEHNWVIFRGIKNYETPEKIVKAGAVVTTKIGRNIIPSGAGAIPIETEIAREAPPRPVIVCGEEAREMKYCHGQVLESGRVVPWRM